MGRSNMLKSNTHPLMVETMSGIRPQHMKLDVVVMAAYMGGRLGMILTLHDMIDRIPFGGLRQACRKLMWLFHFLAS